MFEKFTKSYPFFSHKYEIKDELYNFETRFPQPESRECIFKTTSI